MAAAAPEGWMLPSARCFSGTLMLREKCKKNNIAEHSREGWHGSGMMQNTLPFQKDVSDKETASLDWHGLRDNISCKHKPHKA
jgi:hypothetical protein